MENEFVKVDILLIEDSNALAQAYKEYLRNESWLVDHVDNGASAMEFIYANKPKVVVLDLMLPDMNGMDILRSIHNDNLNISVVVATGTGTYTEANAALKLGAKDFLENPNPLPKFKLINELRAADKDEARSHHLVDFVDNLLLHARFFPQYQIHLEKIYQARQHLQQNVNAKLVLERLAIALSQR